MYAHEERCVHLSGRSCAIHINSHSRAPFLVARPSRRLTIIPTQLTPARGNTIKGSKPNETNHLNSRLITIPNLGAQVISLLHTYASRAIMEVAGIALAVPGLVGQFLKISIEGYKVFSTIRSQDEDFNDYRDRLNHCHLQLTDWVRQMKDMDGRNILQEILTCARDHSEFDRRVNITNTLNKITEVFISAKELETLYLPTSARITSTVTNTANTGSGTGPTTNAKSSKSNKFNTAFSSKLRKLKLFRSDPSASDPSEGNTEKISKATRERDDFLTTLDIELGWV